MADDTREPSSAPDTPPTPTTSNSTPSDSDSDSTARPIRRPRPKHDFPQSQAGKLWDAFGNPAESANTLPGGTYNSAGGKPAPVTWRDAFNFSYDAKGPAWYQVPCARDSLLVGIGGGGAVGGLSFILKGLKSLGRSANFAVGGFVVTSSAMYYWCDRRRKEEARGMAAAVVGMKMLHEKKAKEQAAKEAAEAAAAAARAEAEAEAKRNKRWYKVW
ncbi:hypothetical protein LTR84_012654 [Exophiala bonariae]|uniref:Cytochrome c oxidase assembly protein COX20, mitochondrial n=1 Tax=Exophiala bonariae TaxID=1690606 RepID=A0AAV9NET0_9EURO|nr:hypothetical protein LTR84_012654 [Exophiala bonariae]